METRGAVLWFHGGGWKVRAPEDGAALAAHGLTVIEGAYRFVHEARWPAQLEDARECWRAAREKAGDLPLFVAGDSAGAQVALQLGLRGLDDPGQVAGIMAFWPPTDPLAPDFLDLRAHDNPWEDLIGHTPYAGDEATFDAAPVNHVGNGVPVLLVHGTADASIPVTQTTDLVSALLAAGHPVHALITHGGHALPLTRPDIGAAVDAFLEATLTSS
ncbi:alpha/beta hydrolase [Bailinhaonella thermotolerans]|uniref:Alpha/beta hydrolase n=1 Tax=Bailinhaonella thermotolerans TaxID=1070861 RepID=A0A3A4B487_9ACTN|nr:alpha/beta hydrolase [Bailinhaonella thermotolerans]RJL35981.1 alpha/beta hydrolase [Bailinhaonella thermotolerans]